MQRTGRPATAETRGTSTEKVEPSPGAEEMRIGSSSMRAMRSTMARPKPQPTLLARPVVFGLQAHELVEDDRLLVRRDARAVVLDLEAQELALAPAAEQDALRPALDTAVTQGIRQEVLQDAAQEGWIGVDESPRTHDHQVDVAARRHRREGGRERVRTSAAARMAASPA